MSINDLIVNAKQKSIIIIIIIMHITRRRNVKLNVHERFKDESSWIPDPVVTRSKGPGDLMASPWENLPPTILASIVRTCTTSMPEGIGCTNEISMGIHSSSSIHIYCCTSVCLA